MGAGNSAGQSVLNLANAGARVKMVVRGDRLAKSMSAYLVDRIERHPLIDVRLNTQVRELHAGAHLDAVTVEGSGGRERLPARALFICIGGQPRTGWAADAGVALDRAGYILTGPDLLEQGRRPAGWPLDRDPLALETSVPGHVRRRRRAPWIHEARRRRRRRGRDGRGARAPAAGGAGAEASS